jgi:Domain of unknown function (DUF4823)
MIRGIQILCMLAIAGCTATYTKDAVSVPGVVLQRSVVVAIATPGNGSYNTKEYTASGRSAAQAAQAAFAPFATRTNVVADCSALTCLRRSSADAVYFVVPEILHWEDRATEWSGKKDKLEIKISVYGATGDAPVASSILSGKSKWATFGGDHPEDLLPALLKEYAQSLYGAMSTKL